MAFFGELLPNEPSVYTLTPTQFPKMTSRQRHTPISDRDGFYDLLAWVKASNRRVDILTSLADSPANATEFARRWDVTTEAVHYHLSLLQAGGPDHRFPQLIQIVTPERDNYRLWGLTEDGQDLIKYLE